jgi:hypothetical protein
MTARDPSVYLAPTVPRCAPTSYCPRAATCGRFLATIPAGTPVEDFNRHLWCSSWLAVTHTWPAAASSEPKRPVFKDLGGST